MEEPTAVNLAVLGAQLAGGQTLPLRSLHGSWRSVKERSQLSGCARAGRREAMPASHAPRSNAGAHQR
jgi:hypothetical protein